MKDGFLAILAVLIGSAIIYFLFLSPTAVMGAPTASGQPLTPGVPVSPLQKDNGGTPASQPNGNPACQTVINNSPSTDAAFWQQAIGFAALQQAMVNGNNPVSSGYSMNPAAYQWPPATYALWLNAENKRAAAQQAANAKSAAQNKQTTQDITTGLETAASVALMF